MNISRVGVDIAKSVFHVHGVDRHGRTNSKASIPAASGLMHLAGKHRPAPRLAWRLVLQLTTGLGSFRKNSNVYTCLNQ